MFQSTVVWLFVLLSRCLAHSMIGIVMLALHFVVSLNGRLVVALTARGQRASGPNSILHELCIGNWKALIRVQPL